MTDYERKVNDGYIKAYENMDSTNVYGSLIGIKSHDNVVKDKYINKLFTNNGQDNRSTAEYGSGYGLNISNQMNTSNGSYQ